MTDKTIRIVLETVMKGNAKPKLNDMAAQVDALTKKAQKMPLYRMAQFISNRLPPNMKSSFVGGFVEGLEKGMLEELARQQTSGDVPRKAARRRGRMPALSLSRFGISKSGINPLLAVTGAAGSAGAVTGIGGGPTGVILGVLRAAAGVLVGIGAALTAIALTNKGVRAAFEQAKKAAGGLIAELAKVVAPGFKAFFRIATVMFQRWTEFLRKSQQIANISSVLKSTQFQRFIVGIFVLFEAQMKGALLVWNKLVIILKWVGNELSGIGRFILGVFSGLAAAFGRNIDEVMAALKNLPDAATGGMDKAVREWINGNERLNRAPSVGELQNRYTSRARRPLNVNINVAGVEGPIAGAFAEIARQAAYQMAQYMGAAPEGSY